MRFLLLGLPGNFGKLPFRLFKLFRSCGIPGLLTLVQGLKLHVSLDSISARRNLLEHALNS